MADAGFDAGLGAVQGPFAGRQQCSQGLGLHCLISGNTTAMTLD